MRLCAALHRVLTLGALALCAGCVGTPTIQLGPRLPMVPPPDPTQPLVPSPPPPDAEASPSGRVGSPDLLPPALRTTLATLALYLISGAPPFITIFGFFDENRALD
jgi:hypothetical protein